MIRNLKIIGKTANHIPDSIQAKFNEIPWGHMKGMQNILIHEYFGVDIEVLWKTINDDLPRLKIQIQALLSEIQDSDP